MRCVLPRTPEPSQIESIAIKEVSAPALPNTPQTLGWFAEIKAVPSHVARFYADLWMHFLATSTSVRLLCYQAESRDGMKKLGEMGQKRRSSPLASLHLSVLTGHLPCKSSRGWLKHRPCKGCDTPPREQL